MSVKAIPDGYHVVTPYLSINGAAAAIEFYKRAFKATELYRMQTPSGAIVHAEIKIGDSPIMLADSCDESGFQDPYKLNGTSIGLHLYAEDVDSMFEQALKAGAKTVKPVADQFYGDRNGTLQDPFGHFWFISTHKEDLSPAEITERAQALFARDEV